MPEYLAPGVYVEEISFRAKSIEGVSTSTTGFVGPTLKGPVGGLLDGNGRPTGPGGGLPELLTSFGDFQRIYGGLDDLGYGTNYLAHAVRAYFNEGGSRLYVSRAFRKGADDGTAVSPALGGNDDAHLVRFVARVPGLIGNGALQLQEAATPATRQALDRAPVGSLGASAARPRRPRPACSARHPRSTSRPTAC